MSEEMPDPSILVEELEHPEKPVRKQGGFLPFMLDFGPLLVFFLTYKFSAPSGSGAGFGQTAAAIQGTIAFMVAIVIAVIVSKWKLGKVSPMLWLSAILVIGFGALTVYFHNEKFIQIKPTIIYTFFAVLLLGGWMKGKALLKYIFEAAFDGLDEQGWLKLSRNWGFFFAAMAIANEVMRQVLSFDTWLTVKVWGVTAVSFLFVFANVPMLMRHGLGGEDPDQLQA